jgi:uncharacterized repeat protein (TIGR01451 family)
MSPKRFSQHVANLFPVPARRALVALAMLILLFSLGPGTTSAGLPPGLLADSITATLNDGVPNPSNGGELVSFTWGLDKDGECTFSGTMYLKEGATVLDSIPVPGPMFDLKTNALSVGTHTLYAEFIHSSDAVCNDTSGNVTQTVNKGPSTITVSASPGSPVYYGQEVTFTATIQPSGCPGVVFFDDGGTEIGRATLNGGTAIVKTFALGAGPHRVKAVYLGSDECYEAESPVLPLDVAKANTKIDPFLSSDDDSVYGQYIVFTATVAISETASTPGATTPTGLVTFWSDDGTYQLPMGQESLNGEGQAWFGTSELAVDSYTIKAVYEGDANYKPSEETLGQTVRKANTAVTVTGPGSSYYGKSVTFKAKVSVVPPGAGTPTGKVTFSGWGDDYEATLFEGKATFITMEPKDVGHVTITAEYKGDDNFNSDSGTKGHTVNKARTTTELQDILEETDYGQDARFIVSVKRHEDEPGLGTPTGKITFTVFTAPNFITPTLLFTDTLPANSSVLTVVTNTLQPGDNDVWARYLGDNNFYPSDPVSVTHKVNKADSETSLESSDNPSDYGQILTFTATVEAAGLGFNAPISPTGTVTFKDGATTLGTDTLSDGEATYSTALLDAGTHEIAAEYSGDTSFKSSEDSLRQTVNTIATTTELSGPSSSAIGDTVTFTATVSETLSGDPVTDGEVTFYDGVAVFATRSLVAGVATVVTDILDAGLHPLKAVYNGTENFQASTSGRLYHTVTAAGSNTTLTVPASSVFGQTVTFTATVKADGTPLTSGQVTFYDGATELGSDTLDTSGEATLSTSTLAVGTHTIKARFGGNADYGPSEDTKPYTVDQAKTKTTVTSSPAVSVFGQSVTITATVEEDETVDTPGAGTPTGTVTFTVGAQVLGTAPLDGAGRAVLTTSAIPVGTSQTITADYGGDNNFKESNGTTSHTVNKANTNTTVTTSPPSSLPNDPVTITADVTAQSESTATPTGEVQFASNGSNIGSPVGLVDGSASVNTSFGSEGAYNITADYTNIDGNFNDSSGFTTHNVSATPADLSVTKTDSPDPVNVGQNVTYVINVTNHGPASTTVTLTDTLPSQVTFASVDPAASCNHSDGTVTCDLGNLNDDEDAPIVTIVVTVPIATPAGTVLENTAHVEGLRPDSNWSNNTSIAETTVYRSPRRGDCNGDEAVDLADVWAIVRDIFDPTYVGASGCDANSDSRVDAGDVPSTVLIMFRGANAGIGTALSDALGLSKGQVEGPALAMPDQVSAAPGGLATVPVNFTANGHSITSLAFSVDYDETWLSLDPTDRDGNGVPDAVVFSLPADFTASVTFDEGDADGEVDIFIGDISPPLTSLSDGPIAFVILDAGSSPGGTQGAVLFSLDPAASFGDTSGWSVPGTATPTARQHQIYLPIVTH